MTGGDRETYSKLMEMIGHDVKNHTFSIPYWLKTLRKLLIQKGDRSTNEIIEKLGTIELAMEPLQLLIADTNHELTLVDTLADNELNLRQSSFATRAIAITEEYLQEYRLNMGAVQTTLENLGMTSDHKINDALEILMDAALNSLIARLPSKLRREFPEAT